MTVGFGQAWYRRARAQRISDLEFSESVLCSSQYVYDGLSSLIGEPSRTSFPTIYRQAANRYSATIASCSVFLCFLDSEIRDIRSVTSCCESMTMFETSEFALIECLFAVQKSLVAVTNTREGI
jgi:hypothetical protein